MSIASFRTVGELNAQIEARLQSGFNKRSVQLARANHLDGTPRLLELRQATIVLEIPSRNRSTTYEVTADIYTATVWCVCSAARHNLPCSHAGAALEYLRQMHRASREYADY